MWGGILFVSVHFSGIFIHYKGSRKKNKKDSGQSTKRGGKGLSTKEKNNFGLILFFVDVLLTTKLRAGGLNRTFFAASLSNSFLY